MAHTPGPWWVQIVENIGVGIFGTRGTMGEPVAQVYSPFGDVQQANAHLIAAAPEMLAALEAQETLHKAVWNLSVPYRDILPLEQQADRLREIALAKVKGES